MSIKPATQILQVPFHGDVIDAIRTNDTAVAMVSIKRICENFEISVQGQLEKLSKCEWACIKMILTHDTTGRTQRLAMIDLESLPIWLSHIQTSRVKAAVRPKLIRYQREVKAVLAAWFLGQSTDRPELAREFADVNAKASNGRPFPPRFSLSLPSQPFQMAAAV